MLKKRTGSLKIRVVMLVLALVGVIWAMRSIQSPQSTSGFLDVMMSGQGSPGYSSPQIITRPPMAPEDPAKLDTSVDKGR